MRGDFESSWAENMKMLGVHPRIELNSGMLSGPPAFLCVQNMSAIYYLQCVMPYIICNV